jgi:hypothetical protein
MIWGVLFDKKKNVDLLMARVGEMAAQQAMKLPGSQPMDFTGRPMKGYVFVTPEGFDLDEQLTHWVQLCMDFNPFAVKSKKKK